MHPICAHLVEENLIMRKHFFLQTKKEHFFNHKEIGLYRYLTGKCGIGVDISLYH